MLCIYIFFVWYIKLIACQFVICDVIKLIKINYHYSHFCLNWPKYNYWKWMIKIQEWILFAMANWSIWINWGKFQKSKLNLMKLLPQYPIWNLKISSKALFAHSPHICVCDNIYYFCCIKKYFILFPSLFLSLD